MEGCSVTSPRTTEGSGHESGGECIELTRTPWSIVSMTEMSDFDRELLRRAKLRTEVRGTGFTDSYFLHDMVQITLRQGWRPA